MRNQKPSKIALLAKLMTDNNNIKLARKLPGLMIHVSWSKSFLRREKLKSNTKWYLNNKLFSCRIQFSVNGTFCEPVCRLRTFGLQIKSKIINFFLFQPEKRSLLLGPINMSVLMDKRNIGGRLSYVCWAAKCPCGIVLIGSQPNSMFCYESASWVI